MLTGLGQVRIDDVKTPGVVGEKPTTVRQDELQVWKAVQDAAKEHGADRCCGVIEIVSQGVQVIFADARRYDGLNRVEKYRHLEFHRSTPEFVEGRRIEVLPCDIGANHAPNGATLTHAIGQLLSGPGRIL